MGKPCTHAIVLLAALFTTGCSWWPFGSTYEAYPATGQTSGQQAFQFPSEGSPSYVNADFRTKR